MFGKVTDPVCGMKIEKKNAITAHGKHFCSQTCADAYAAGLKTARKAKKGGCC